MLENIHIQNFRCFEDFKAEGFERINLIGGKNNSGKTCLLEALATFSYNYTFGDVMALRGGDLLKFHNKNIGEKVIGKHLLIKINRINFQNVTIENENILLHEGHNNLIFIGPNFELPNNSTINLLKNIIDSEVKNKLISILKIIDNHIEDIRVSSDENEILISQYHQDFQPINLFGDAIKKTLKYFVPFLETARTKDIKNGVAYLLIDEIENGLHYTAHEEFWQHIFRLSKELNVQVFATTHSLEMIKAFNKVAKEFEKENPKDKGAYFEMVRDEKTNQINAIKHSTNILDEELDMNLKVRGEVFKEKLSITPKLLESLNNAAKNAQTNLKTNKIPVPFIKDGWIWETLPDGTEQKLEELQSLNLK